MDIDKPYFPPYEKPLERLVSDGGFCGIFRTIACVGDSLASGDFETVVNGCRYFIDVFDYSWGQYIARAAGCTVYNFSRGGMTAKEYTESFASAMCFWNTEKAAQAYIIALGCNDFFEKDQLPIGDISDVCDDYRKNANTFVGKYAEIIQRYKIIAPDAKFFLMTMPDEDMDEDGKNKLRLHHDLIHKIAEEFSNCYVIDLYEYAPVQTAEFKEKFYLEGHLNPCGYVLFAQLIMSYIDYIVRHNIEDFKRTAFINTEFGDSKMQKRQIANGKL